MNQSTLYFFMAFLSSTLLFSSCSERSQTQATVTAMQTTEKVRENWKESQHPVEITLEGIEENTTPLPHIGVYAHIGNALPEEKQAFQGVSFNRKGQRYVSSDRNAVTSDTAIAVYACFPYRQGLTLSDTLLLKAPFGENLYGAELKRNVTHTVQINMKLHSSMALLRILFKSDNIRDMLDGVSIAGECVYSQGKLMPYTGNWLEREKGNLSATNADCLLDNGREHDFYLIPTETAGTAVISARINGRSHHLKVTLPPMPPGSLTHLNLHHKKEGLAVSGSWVETQRPLAVFPTIQKTDSVKTGYYLQADGTLCPEQTPTSVAIVFDTDGKHGKAVALTDSPESFVFANILPDGTRKFPTIDGKRKEGVINPSRSETTNPDEKIIFKPGMPYRKHCALGYDDGATLTQALLESQKQSDGHPETLFGRRPMLTEIERHPGSYIPSLSEMANLYYLSRFSGLFREHPSFVPLNGEYLTCSESSESTFYLMDFTYGIVSGNCSKRYVSAKLRLFYLF